MQYFMFAFVLFLAACGAGGPTENDYKQDKRLGGIEKLVRENTVKIASMQSALQSAEIKSRKLKSEVEQLQWTVQSMEGKLEMADEAGRKACKELKADLEKRRVDLLPPTTTSQPFNQLVDEQIVRQFIQVYRGGSVMYLAKKAVSHIYGVHPETSGNVAHTARLYLSNPNRLRDMYRLMKPIILANIPPDSLAVAHQDLQAFSRAMDKPITRQEIAARAAYEQAQALYWRVPEQHSCEAFFSEDLRLKGREVRIAAGHDEFRMFAIRRHAEGGQMLVGVWGGIAKDLEMALPSAPSQPE